MADGLEGINEKSLRRAQAYKDSLERAQKILEQQEKLTGKITSNLLGVDGSHFYRQLTSGEITAKTQQLNADMEKYKLEAKTQGEALGNVFKNILENSELSGKSVKEIADNLNLTAHEGEVLKKYMTDNGELSGNLVDLIAELGEKGKDFAHKISTAKGITEDLKGKWVDNLDKIQEINDKVEETSARISDANTKVLDLAKGFAAVGDNITKKVLASIVDFDKTIKKAQIDTGINFTENTTQMAMLTSETARFGMSVQETAQLMGDLGAELRTANFHVLSEAAEDLAAMQKATGLTSQNTAKLAREFMLFGQSAKDVAEFSEDVMNQARVYGVSGKEIMDDMAANMSKMRQMGFVGGEQSLARMALEAKRLGMSIEDIFSVAKKARNIEGAMEMAAELQLAGGSFAQIDPMQLLSAARKGPEELQKILAQMGSDIGTWDEENKKMVFDPIDVDRLNMVADATGMSLDSLQNMIGKNAEDAKKMDLLPPSLFGADLDDEQKAFLMNAVKIGESGELELNAKVDGISELSQLTADNITAGIQQEIEKKETLEKQAQQNMAFTESIEALKNSFLNIFAVFQPVLQGLSNALNKLNEMPAFAKVLVAGIIGAGAIIFSTARAIMQGINMAKGFQIGMQGGGFFKQMGASIKSALPFGKGAATSTLPIPETGGDGDKVGSASSESGGGLKGLAKGLKAMGTDAGTILKGIGNTALAGPALLLMIPAIPGLLILSGVGAMKDLVVRGFEALAEGFSTMGKAEGIFKGALAMAIIGASIIPFAYALQMMTDVSWTSVVAGLGFLLVSAGIIMALGSIMTSGVGAVAILLGATAMIVIAGAVLVFASALNVMVPAAEALSQIGFGWLFEMGMALLGASPGLLLGGIALLTAAPLILAGSFMLGLATEPLTKIAQTDWSGMASFADSLFLLGPAMLAFGAAGLFLFNPLMLLGMTTMFTALGVLGSIMQSLGPNLEQGASGIERMAEGVIKLEQAVSNLDTDKLSSLRNLAFSFATGGAGMGKMIAAISGGGGTEGGSERKVVHVVKLELDGKMLKEIELRDNKHRI